MKITTLALLITFAIPLIGCSEPSQIDIIHGYCSDVYPGRVNAVINKVVIQVEKSDTTSTKKGGRLIENFVIEKYGELYMRDLIAEEIIEAEGKKSKLSCEEQLKYIESKLDSLNPR